MYFVRYDKDRQCVSAYDGQNRIGECTYRIVSGDWVIDHTFVEEAYQGTGMAGRMVDRVADEARKAGAGLVADCPYARKRLGQAGTGSAEDRKKQGEQDLLELLGRVPGKVSDLQDEIDRMKQRQKR